MAEKNMNQDSNRKFNPDNIPPKGDDQQKKKPRFNIYWVYGIIFLSIVGWNLYRGVSSAGIETDQQKFYSMVLQGDVTKIKTIRNKKIVRVFVDMDSLKNKAAVQISRNCTSALLMIRPLLPRWVIFIKRTPG